MTPGVLAIGGAGGSKVSFASLLLRVEFGYCTVELLQQLVRRIAFRPCGTHPNTPKGYGRHDIQVRMIVGDPSTPKYRKFDPFVPVSAIGQVLVCEPLVQTSTQPITYKEGSGAMSLGQFTVCDEQSLGYRSWNGGQLRVQIVKGGNPDDRIYIRSLDPNVSDAGLAMVEVDPFSIVPAESRRSLRKESVMTTQRRSLADLNSADSEASMERERLACPGPPAAMLDRVRKAVSTKDKSSGSFRTSELYTAERSFLGVLTSALSECHVGFREFEKKRANVAKHQMSFQVKKTSSGRSEEKVPAGAHRRDVVPASVLAKLPPGCTPIKRKDIQNLLKLVTYECRSANPVELRKIIRLSITDGCATSFTDVLIEVNVQPVDDATEIRRSTIGPIPFRNGYFGALLPVFEHCTLFDADTELFNSGFFVATLSAGDSEGDELYLLSREEQRALRTARSTDPFARFRAAPKRPPPPAKRKKSSVAPSSGSAAAGGEAAGQIDDDGGDGDSFVPDFVSKYKRPDEYEFEFDYATGEIFAVDDASEVNAFASTTRVGTFAINTPKAKSGEPSINIAFHFPALLDEENYDPDEDQLTHRPVPIPLSLVEALMKCVMYRSTLPPTKVRTGNRTISARVSPGGGAEEGRIKLVAQVTPALITLGDSVLINPPALPPASGAAVSNAPVVTLGQASLALATAAPQAPDLTAAPSPAVPLPTAVAVPPPPSFVYRKRMGAIQPLAKLLVLADILLKVGFVAVEVIEGFNSVDDVIKIGDIGTSRMFQLKSQGKALYTNKDLYCGGFMAIEEGGAMRGFCLSFDSLSRVSGSMVQMLVRSVSFGNVAKKQVEGTRRIRVTLCDGTVNETSQFDVVVRVELDEELIDTAWGPTGGTTVLLLPPKPVAGSGSAVNTAPSSPSANPLELHSSSNAGKHFATVPHHEVAPGGTSNSVFVHPFCDLQVLQATAADTGEPRLLVAPACLEIEAGKGDVLSLVSSLALGVSAIAGGTISVNGQSIGAFIRRLPFSAAPPPSAKGPKLSRTPREDPLQTLPPSQRSVDDSDTSSDTSASSFNMQAVAGSSSSSNALLLASRTPRHHNHHHDGASASGGTNVLRIRFDSCPFSHLQQVLQAVRFSRPDGELGRHQLRLTVYGAQQNAMLKLTAVVDVTVPMFSCGQQFLSPISEIFPTCSVQYVPRTIRISWRPVDDAAAGASAVAHSAVGEPLPSPRNSRVSLVVNTRMGIIRKENDLMHEKDKVGTILPPASPDAAELVVELTRKATVLMVQRLMRSFALAPNIHYLPHMFTVDFICPGGAQTSETFSVLYAKRR